MTESEHAPCPFCGHDGDDLTVKFEHHPKVTIACVICPECGAEGPPVFNEDPYSRWDARVPEIVANELAEAS